MSCGAGSFAIASPISAVFVAVIALTTHVRFADVIVAFAPGAMDAMLALALTLHSIRLRRRASFVTLRVRHHHDAGHRPSVSTPAGRCRR